LADIDAARTRHQHEPARAGDNNVAKAPSAASGAAAERSRLSAHCAAYMRWAAAGVLAYSPKNTVVPHNPPLPSWDGLQT